MAQTVYVVMSNDFPDSVFSNEPAADAYAARKNSADKDEWPHRRVFWRVYEFPLDAKTA